MDKKLQLSKRLAGYSATAAAMVAVGANADAQTYSGLKNIPVDNTTVNIDIDGDGTNDFSISNGSEIFSIPGSYSYTMHKSSIKKLDGGTGWIKRDDYHIAAFSGLFYDNSTFVSNTWDFNIGSDNDGIFAGMGDKYIATKLANNKLAWIRINVAANNVSLVVKDWAYYDNFELYTGKLIPEISGTAITDVTETTAKLSLTSNAEGTAYWCVKAAADAAPTKDEIKAATGFVVAGNANVSSNINKDIAISGLSANNLYKVYFYVENDLHASNKSAISSVNINTDFTAPVLSSVSVDGITDTEATAHLTSDEDGTAYYVILAASATAPTAAEIKAATTLAGNVAVTAGAAKEIALSGLTSETDYKAYMVVEDATGNISDVSHVAFSTADITAPVLSAVSVDGITGTAATAHLTSNEAGTAFYVVLAASATAPTAAEIKAATTLAGNVAVTAATAKEIALSGLTSETAYKVYMVVEDASGNISEISNAAFTTADVTAPVLSDVSVYDISLTTATAWVTSNEVGTAYYVVLAASATAPTASEIKTATTLAGNGPVTAGAAVDFNISGLSPETDYKVYIVVEDASGNISEVSSSAFTSGDAIAPVISDANVEVISNASVILQINSNEDGTAFYVVLSASATAPTAAEIKAATNFAGYKPISADLIDDINISGLTPDTDYKVYFMVEDIFGNISVVSNVAFTTADVTAPVLSGVSVNGITGTAATAHFTSNEAGTAYYVVLAASATAPTTAEIKAATILAGNAAVTASTAKEFAITGLSSETAYKVYMVVEDATGNVSDVSHVAFTTADVTAPVLSAVTVDSITGTAAKAQLTSNEAGTAYYVVLAASATAPTAAEIKAATTLAGNVAVAAGKAKEIAISGLTSETAYKAYMVVEDASGNISAVSNVAFTTADVTTPVLSAVSVDAITGTTATAHLTSNEAGTAYYVVLAASATAPTAAEIKAATALAGNVAVTAGTAKEIALSGLTSETAYKAYMVVEDASGNISMVSHVAFTTAKNNSSIAGVDVQLNIYPNPVSDILFVNVSNSSAYRLVNIAGVTISSGRLEAGNNSIDVSGLEKGNYFIYIQQNSAACVKKVIIK